MKNANISTKTMVRALGVGLAFSAAMTAAMAFTGTSETDLVQTRDAAGYTDLTETVASSDRLGSVDHLFADASSENIRVIEGVTMVPGR